MATQIQRHTFTVDDYHRMLEGGILTEDDRVELICGEIVAMAPIGSKHWAIVNRLTRQLVLKLAGRSLVSIQSSLRLSETSEPEPDVAVFRPKEDDYYSALPTPMDAYLVIEVADTTAAYDRDTKMPLYGKAGISEAWLVDLVSRRIEIYTEPTPNGYTHLRYAYPGDTVAPFAFPDVTLDVDSILI